MSKDNVKLLKEQYPSNSYNSKEKEAILNEKAEKKEVKKVISGSVVEKKPTITEKIEEVFLVEDARSVGGYLMSDVVIPAVKNAISDLVTSGIEALLFGRTGTSRKRTGFAGGTHVSYNSISSSNKHNNTIPIKKSKKRDYIFQSREEADIVLGQLLDNLQMYDVVTVADFCDSIGITSDYVDQNWGWLDLSTAQIRRVREGYLLMLPTPMPIGE